MNFYISILIILSVFSFHLSQSATIQCDKDDAAYVDITTLAGYQANPEYTKQYPDGLCSYTGYFSVGVSQQFYWYFPSESNLPLEQIPVVVYIGGAPGTSVLTHLFTQSGPLTIFQNANKKDILTEKLNSWTKTMSVIYVEIQTTVGFNVGGNGYRNVELMSKDLEAVLKEITSKKFPKQQVTLYANDFGAKIALQTDVVSNGIKNVILDNPLIDTSIARSSIGYGNLGLGVLGPEYIKTVEDLAINCDDNFYNTYYEKCYVAFQELLVAQSGLDPLDVTLIGQNSVQKGYERLENYFKVNYLADQTILHATHSFTIFNQEMAQFLSADYISNYTTQLGQFLKTLNVNIFYGEFNMINGPYAGTQTLINALKIDYNQFPEKHVYTTGISSEKSGVKMGYYYPLDGPLFKDYPNSHFFVINQGAYLNTWQSASNELVFNMATQVGDFCYSYNQRSCNMSSGQELFMNSCQNGKNGSWDTTNRQCVCNEGFTGADCSYAIIVISSVDDFNNIKSLKPREWVYLQIAIQDLALLQITSEQFGKDGDVISLAPAFKGDLEIYQSLPVLKNLQQDFQNPYAKDSFQFNGVAANANEVQTNVYNMILKQDTEIFISIRNNDFWHPVGVQFDLSKSTKSPSSFEAGQWGFITNIVMVSLSVVFIVVGMIFTCKKPSAA